MSDPPPLERLVAEVPEELKRLVDADKRTNREIVEAALWTEFGGEKEAAIDRRIEEKKKRISLIKSERNERNRELEEQREELKTLQTKKEKLSQEEENHWKEAVENITPTNPQKRLSSYDAETWTPNPENKKVQIYAERLEITPEEFCERFPEKRREFDAI
jgi:chromosome segregation ATPase